MAILTKEMPSAHTRMINYALYLWNFVDAIIEETKEASEGEETGGTNEESHSHGSYFTDRSN